MIFELKSRARAYDEWRASVKVYNALDASPSLSCPLTPEGEETEAVAKASFPTASSSMAYYESILEGVESERVNVPVLMHAMLEQVI